MCVDLRLGAAKCHHTYASALLCQVCAVGIALNPRRKTHRRYERSATWKLRTVSPEMRNHLVIIALLILAICTALTAQLFCLGPDSTSSAPEPLITNFYVSPAGGDDNSGSASAPWRTIQHASKLAQPGWTVHVAPGTYDVSSLVTTTSGTASARIRYISDIKWGAKLVGSGTEIIWEVDASYVDIVGFDITGPNRLGIMIGWSGSGSGHDYILNNNIHDLTVSAGCTGTGGAAIDTSFAPWGTGSNLILGNRVANIGASMIGTCNSIQGIYVGTANDIIENNIVSGVALAAIQQWHGATNSTIVNNTVFHSNVGILIGDGDGGALPGGSANNYVANNIALNNAAIGIEEYGLVGSGNSYVNNLVWNNPTNYSVSSASPVGNGSSDPLFVNYQADGSGDYHLTSLSPAIDKGTSLRAPQHDFDGGARPVGATWDIGAYEEGTTPVAWPWQ
jgi:hypothetical protein